MRKILEKTILSCGVQVKSGPSNVFLEDRYGALIFFYLMRFLCCCFRRCTIAEFATPTVWWETNQKRKIRLSETALARRLTLNGTVFHLKSFFNLLIFQCPANSITSRIQTMNVFSFLVPLHFQTTRFARMEQSTGMNGHHTD